MQWQMLSNITKTEMWDSSIIQMTHPDPYITGMGRPQSNRKKKKKKSALMGRIHNMVKFQDQNQITTHLPSDIIDANVEVQAINKHSMKV